MSGPALDLLKQCFADARVLQELTDYAVGTLGLQFSSTWSQAGYETELATAVAVLVEPCPATKGNALALSRVRAAWRAEYMPFEKPPLNSAKRSLDNPETQSPATGVMPKTANMLGAKYTCKKYNDSRVRAESHSRRHCCDILKPDNQLWSRITQGCSVLSARDCLRPRPALCILAPLSPQQILERKGSVRLADLGPTAVPAVASVS